LRRCKLVTGYTLQNYLVTELGRRVVTEAVEAGEVLVIDQVERDDRVSQAVRRMTADYTGTRVLITGSSRGIGFALARGFARAGAAVVLNARTEAQATDARDRLQDELTAGDTGSAHTSVFDVTDTEAVQSEITRLEEQLGPIDVLVNNAGIQRRGPLEEMPVDDWNAVIATNLTGPFVVSQAVARPMLGRGAGVIINICSVQSALVRPSTASYAASKTGLVGLTRSMCAEWAPRGLRVNGLAPGYLDTELNSVLTSDVAFTEWITGRTPARRWGEVDDIVGPALWLASDEARFVNGQIIYADGGITAVI